MCFIRTGWSTRKISSCVKVFLFCFVLFFCLFVFVCLFFYFSNFVQVRKIYCKIFYHGYLMYRSNIPWDIPLPQNELGPLDFQVKAQVYVDYVIRHSSTTALQYRVGARWRRHQHRLALRLGMLKFLIMNKV